ncbi:chitinase [Daldinia childiae]|uniref:chitinase n=1 Tax=Daldinia childiae TaxID=326645 RepID=UPI001447611F|nr:chitinase [Daldinia childiae]KAF3061280.1 chitinase [Daldinia childiae]
MVIFLMPWRVAATILSCISVVGAIEFPATLDVDIIYPRNGTFAPTVLTPIIFAIRNPQLAEPLVLNFQWDIYKGESPLSDGPFSFGSKDLQWVDFSNISDPYFVYTSTNKLNFEDSWWIRWSVAWGNCSESPGTIDPVKTSFSYRNNVVEFTTKNGTRPLDLSSVNTADDDTCGNVTDTRVTFNVTGVLDTSFPSRYGGRETCAVLASSSNSTAPPPTRTCGAEVGASAASSILAAITSQACAGFATNPNVACPTESPSSAARGKGAQFLAGSTTWLKTLTFARIMYNFVL